jgi:hypothetical protein
LPIFSVNSEDPLLFVLPNILWFSFLFQLFGIPCRQPALRLMPISASDLSLSLLPTSFFSSPGSAHPPKRVCPISCSAGKIPAKSCSYDSDSFGLDAKDSDSIRNRIRVRQAPNFEKMNCCKISDVFTTNFHLQEECLVQQFLSKLLNKLFGRPTDKIRVLRCFFCQFWFGRLLFLAHPGLGLVASLNRFLDVLLESSRSPAKINRQKNRIIRNQFPESSQH